MAWSIFTDGGGKGVAKQWAIDELRLLGAPQTPADVQFIYDWEVSEGGGGKYNPLNQGPVPGHPELTTTGSQYGGGAADYASWQAGLTGAADYLAMPAYSGVRTALLGGQAAAARQALIDSPWAASHYGYGSGFSGEAAPAQAQALPAVGSTTSSGGGGFSLNPLNWPGQIVSAIASPITKGIEEAVIVGPLVLAGGALIVVGLWKATSAGQKIRSAGETAGKAAAAGAVLA